VTSDWFEHWLRELVMVSIFVSYSHKDEDLWAQLQTHLAMLKRQGVIDIWHDRRIKAGDEIDNEISAALEGAQAVLLLVSADFLASDYCYDREMIRAVALHESGQVRLIPVILRPCDWSGAPFGRLRATPTDGKPVTKWPNVDEAFLAITQDIRAAVTQVAGERQKHPAQPVYEKTKIAPAEVQRSSNLLVKKKFTDADRSRFLKDAFEFIAKYFENSLGELQIRNQGIETIFQRVDARRFTAEIFRHGRKESVCKILTGTGLGDITYANEISMPDTSCNASLSIKETDQALVFEAMMMRADESNNLSVQGAAELLWSRLVEPLQR
jgi:hypothetical protein